MRLPMIEANSKDEYIKSYHDEVDVALCGLFQEILGVKKVGMKDDFFELGGDSIKAIRMLLKIQDLGYQITIEDFMQNTVIDDLAKVCKHSSEN